MLTSLTIHLTQTQPFRSTDSTAPFGATVLTSAHVRNSEACKRTVYASLVVTTVV